ncbi:MAG: YqgE/AlgH family protein, partial [Planctomycetales bacterium]|nr:YqgE/AlgH family protein [Planctomycetales bacterium]
GVILNRPLNESVRALWQKLGESSCRINQKLNLGGPVSGPLIALHDLESLSDFRVLPGLCVSEQKESIQQLVQLPDKPMRIYVGHAGWSAQQLEEEITEGAWHVMPARIEHVFCDSEYMWLAAMQEIGLAFYHEVLGIDYVPADVTMN